MNDGEASLFFFFFFNLNEWLPELKTVGCRVIYDSMIEWRMVLEGSFVNLE